MRLKMLVIIASGGLGCRSSNSRESGKSRIVSRKATKMKDGHCWQRSGSKMRERISRRVPVYSFHEKPCHHSGNQTDAGVCGGLYVACALIIVPADAPQ
jgi:hypothetical protein